MEANLVKSFSRFVIDYRIHVYDLISCLSQNTEYIVYDLISCLSHELFGGRPPYSRDTDHPSHVIVHDLHSTLVTEFLEGVVPEVLEGQGEHGQGRVELTVAGLDQSILSEFLNGLWKTSVSIYAQSSGIDLKKKTWANTLKILIVHVVTISVIYVYLKIYSVKKLHVFSVSNF